MSSNCRISDFDSRGFLFNLILMQYLSKAHQLMQCRNVQAEATIRK